MSAPSWLARIVSIVRRDDDDRALDETVRAHLAMATADRFARGEDPGVARAAARRESRA